jgi:spermidine synthase
MPQKKSLVLVTFAGLFLISGAAGLIYEIVWERLLGLYFGVTMISVTLIVAAYMGGLGIGSLLGGYLSRRTMRTLFVYGLLELGIAAFGLISPSLIIQVGQRLAGSPYGLAFLTCFGILLIPTTLMGMTLPFLVQSFVKQVQGSGEVIGVLYGINTLGAAIGAILSAYVLIGRLGFDGSTYFAVGLNTIVGLSALLLMRWGQIVTTQTPDLSRSPAPNGRWGYTTILLSSFLVGFIGLGFEMLWIRILLIVNKNTAFAFPSILFTFLIGLALGGYFFGRKADRTNDPVLLFCRIELGGAALAVFTLLFFWWSLSLDPPWIQNFIQTQNPAIPYIKIGHEWLFSRRQLLTNLWNYFLPIFILVLPASFVLGGGLPVLDRIAINNAALAGRRVGDIHLANILGSVGGTLTISFVLLPFLGSEWTMKLLALLTLLFPLTYLSRRGTSSSGTSTLRGLAALGAIVVLGVFLTPGKTRLYQSIYQYSTGGEVRISESGDSLLALTFEPGSQNKNGLFWIGGEVNSFFPPKGVYENRALACAGAAEPERVLVIGFGGGYTALFYQSLPEIDEIVIVELLGDVAPFLSHNFESTRSTLADPRVQYLVDDGRRYLNAQPEEKFDLIVIDPLRDHTAGHNNLYSEQAMQLYLDHLQAGGVLCAWINETRLIPHTAARVFPYVDQFQNEVLVASDLPISYNRVYMDAMADHYRMRADQLYPDGLEGYPSTSAALSEFDGDQDVILAEEAGTPYLTDLTPWLEYYLFRKPVK